MKNDQDNSHSINWRKYFWVGMVLLVVGYTLGRPTLEKWTGWDLPSLTEEDHRQANDANEEFDFSTNLPSNSGSKDSSAAASESFALKKTSGNKYVSPAGLIYAMGPRGEHRVDHVLRHAEDNPSRPVHSVFEGDRNTILKIIDDGYDLISNGSNRVKSSKEGNRTGYTIDMQRKIGFEGGQKGKRNNYPALKRLKLILQDENYVVTAYPCR